MSNLTFVDNTLMFYNVKVAQLQHLKHLFLGYQACLKINLRNVRTSCGRGGEYWETCTCFQLQSWITSNNLPWSTVYLWKLLIRTVHFGIQWLRKSKKTLLDGSISTYTTLLHVSHAHICSIPEKIEKTRRNFLSDTNDLINWKVARFGPKCISSRPKQLQYIRKLLFNPRSNFKSVRPYPSLDYCNALCFTYFSHDCSSSSFLKSESILSSLVLSLVKPLELSVLKVYFSIPFEITNFNVGYKMYRNVMVYPVRYTSLNIGVWCGLNAS